MTKQIEKNTRWKQAAIHACDGIIHVYRTERNFRFHLFASVVVVILGFLLQLTITEWCSVLLCIFMMLILEMLNTVVEEIVDLLVEKKYHIAAKHAKDVAAGAVLCGAIFSVGIGGMIFIPKFLEFIE